MPEQIFHEGDVVIPNRQVIDKLKRAGNTGISPGYNNSMDRYLDTQCIVKRIHRTGRHDDPYWLVLEGDWKWKPEWVLPAFENEEQAFVSYVEGGVNGEIYKNFLKSVKNF